MNMFSEFNSLYVDILLHCLHLLGERQDWPLTRAVVAKIVRQAIRHYDTSNSPTTHQRRYLDMSSFEKSVLQEHDEAHNLNVLHKDIDGKYHLAVRVPLVRPCNHIERSWLAYALKQPQAGLFLDPKTKDKLLQASSPPPVSLDEHLISKGNNQHDSLDPDSIRRKVSLLTAAIASGKGIISSYATQGGLFIEEQTTIPYMLEYSFRDDVFYLIHIASRPVRPIKSLVAGLYDIAVCDLDDEQEQLRLNARSFVAGLKSEGVVRLQINDIKNALERTLSEFAAYERKLSFAENNCYLDVQVMSYEQLPLIAKVLSLGNNVLVLEPQWLVAEIVAAMRKSVSRHTS